MKELLLLSRLLEYPDADGLLGNLAEARETLDHCALPESHRTALAGILDWLAATDAWTVQETYVDKVDRSRLGSLYLFEHLHGESRDRGGAMVDLQTFYQERGLELKAGELPDYLPAVLEFAAASPADRGLDFLKEMRHLVEGIYRAHLGKESPWAPVFAAILALTGPEPEKALQTERPALVENPDADALWAEPAVTFAAPQGGCP